MVNSCIQWGFGKVLTNGRTVYEHKRSRKLREQTESKMTILSKAGFSLSCSKCSPAGKQQVINRRTKQSRPKLPKFRKLYCGPFCHKLPPPRPVYARANHFSPKIKGCILASIFFYLLRWIHLWSQPCAGCITATGRRPHHAPKSPEASLCFFGGAARLGWLHEK